MTRLNHAMRAIAIALAPSALLTAGCAQAQGIPYNAAAVPTLTRGASTPGDARRVLGQPLGAWPLHVTASEAKEQKLPCPNVAERWTYRYQDDSSYQAATSSCGTTLEFDDSGLLCSVVHGSSFDAKLASKGPRCEGKR